MTKRLNHSIDVGDLVAVSIHAGDVVISPSAIVEYMPVATGDSWIFRDTKTNQIHYISEGCTVSKLDS